MMHDPKFRLVIWSPYVPGDGVLLDSWVKSADEIGDEWADLFPLDIVMVCAQ